MRGRARASAACARARALIVRLCAPRASAWYDRRTQAEVLGITMFSELEEALGTFGLTGLDRLLCFMIVQQLQDFLAIFRRRMKGDAGLRDAVHQAAERLDPAHIAPSQPHVLYPQLAARLAKLWPDYAAMACRVGQMQILRRLIAHKLQFSCKVDSKVRSLHAARPRGVAQPGVGRR